jgi:hypothetical protein
MSVCASESPVNPGEGERQDRRQESRFTVHGEAGLILVKSGSRMVARILDLSRSGCRLRTEQCFMPGIFVRVEVEFHLRGNTFRVAGVSQSIHDRNTVGIRFLDVSPRWREKLQELIEEVDALGR